MLTKAAQQHPSLQHLRATLIHTERHATEKFLDYLSDFCQGYGDIVPLVFRLCQFPRGHSSLILVLLKVFSASFSYSLSPGQLCSSSAEHSLGQSLFSLPKLH